MVLGGKDHKGQVQTMEAFIATFILLAVLAVTVQATSVTPLTTSFTNQHIKYELQNTGQDLLTSMDEAPYSEPVYRSTQAPPSKLEKSIRDWLVGEYGTLPAGDVAAIPGDWYTYDGVQYFISATTSHYHEQTTELEKALIFAFSDNGIAFNVEVRYPDETGNVQSAKMFWNGDPSDNCVTVSRYVALHDNDNPSALNDAYLGDGLLPAADWLVPDRSTDTIFHNVVEVRLTLWVM